MRDRKLEAMRMHKLNVERRMKPNTNNNEGQMYWSQRNDKLKRYPKYEALDPSWYTDNIYSNDSIDLDDDTFTSTKKVNEYNSQKYYYGINDSIHDDFERKKGEHNDIDYNYPKSRSCCFGSGYDERPKPILMPKSNSFSISTTTHRITKDNIHTINPYRIDEEDDSLNESDVERYGIRNCYCWENERQLDSCDKMMRNEIYHIGSDRDKHNKRNNNNNNRIRNSWRNRSQLPNYKHQNGLDEINGNYIEEFNPHNSFEEEYLIVQQDKPIQMDNYNNRNVFCDDLLSISRRQSQYSNGFDHCYGDDKTSEILRNNDDYEQYENDTLNNYRHRTVKSKNMLEVQPPKRYDDSSSDSTDLELDDFSFDFEKYWNELDKSTTNSSATITSNNQYDLDYGINTNSNKCKKKYSNVNHQKNNQLNRNKKKMRTNSDTKTNTFEHYDIDEDIDGDVNDNYDFNKIPDRYYNAYDYEPTNYGNDNLLSPHRSMNAHQYISSYNKRRENRTISHSNSFQKDHYHSVPLSSDDRSNNDYHSCIEHQNDESEHDEDIRNNNNKIVNGTYGGAINLINNIFSIYKPRKYSPINCRTSDVHVKSPPITKIMNIPSTARPLGVPFTNYATSMKRPLTISSSCFTAKRSWTGPSPTVDQPYFKIIPQKTGLKISPLYPFGSDNEYNLRLKCTARPLLFPI